VAEITNVREMNARWCKFKQATQALTNQKAATVANELRRLRNAALCASRLLR